jgi:hypothetical protein
VAVALSLLLHAGLLAVWMKKEPRQPRALQPAAAAMQWVDVVAAPPAAPARRAEVAVAQVLAYAASGRPVVAGGSARPVLEMRAAASLAGAAVAGEDKTSMDKSTPFAGAAVLPQPATSSPITAPATSASWDADGIARALQLERAWQRRQGFTASQALAQRQEALASGLPMGQVVSVQESVGADGSRVSRVQGAAGTYCVRVPSANRMQDVSAAPRVASVTNCP